MKTKKSSAILAGLLAAAAFALATAASSHAALMSAVGVSTDMGTLTGNLNHTIDGSGLSSLSLTATHGTDTDANSWVSALSGPVVVEFDLGDTFSVDGFSFWNANNGQFPFFADNGIRNVAISYSVDGMTFQSLPGAPTLFAMESGSTSSAQQFTFPAVDLGYVRFNILNNYSDSRTAFAEVQFNTVVPEPGTALVGIACVGVAAFRRRRSA